MEPGDTCTAAATCGGLLGDPGPYAPGSPARRTRVSRVTCGIGQRRWRFQDQVVRDTAAVTSSTLRGTEASCRQPREPVPLSLQRPRISAKPVPLGLGQGPDPQLLCRLERGQRKHQRAAGMGRAEEAPCKGQRPLPTAALQLSLCGQARGSH